MKPTQPTTTARTVAAPVARTVDLRRTATLRRTDALFKAMASDFLLREQFVTEPTQVLAEYVHSGRVATELADASNQLVYAIMASPGLLTWLRGYASKAGAAPPSRERLVRDLLRAVVATDSHHVVFALARASVERQDVLSDDAALTALLDLIAHGAGGIFAQTEMSTGHSTGTEMSTGHVFATEMSTGHVFTTEMSTGHSTGTEMSTGHVFTTEMSTGHSTGTEMSTGHVFTTEMSTGHSTGTEMSTGHVFTTEMSTGHSTGTEMSTGHVFTTEMSTGHSTGTEMSTGHVFTTEMSTGHSTGTEMSTGHSIGPGLFRPGYQRVALTALAEFAMQLRRAGALDRIFTR